MSTIQLGDIAMEKTSSIGGSTVGIEFEVKTPTGRPVKWIHACWDGEVIKGLAVKFHGSDDLHTVADWNNGAQQFHRSSLEIAKDDLLKEFKISTSKFGYVSVRGIFVQTRAMREMWNAGNITDTPSQLDVADRYLMGIYGTRNSDNFINSLGLWVSKKK
jgi:hypothetical protein